MGTFDCYLVAAGGVGVEMVCVAVGGINIASGGGGVGRVGRKWAGRVFWMWEGGIERQEQREEVKKSGERGGFLSSGRRASGLLDLGLGFAGEDLDVLLIIRLGFRAVGEEASYTAFGTIDGHGYSERSVLYPAPGEDLGASRVEVADRVGVEFKVVIVFVRENRVSARNFMQEES